MALTSSWQQVTAVYTPVTSGASLDVEIYASSAPVGVCLQADDASITHQPTVAPPTNQPPTPDAGPDQAVTRPDAAALTGSVTDDGLPSRRDW